MSKKFLVAVDGSDHGWKALDLATSLTSPSDTELVLVHVVQSEPIPEGLEELARAERIPLEEEKARYHNSSIIGDKIILKAKERARETGFAQPTTHVVEGNISNWILKIAELEGVEMIFLGSRGLGNLESLLMGGVSHKVNQLAPCTCVTVK